MNRDPLGLIGTPALAEASEALHRARRALDDQLRVRSMPTSFAFFGVRRDPVTQRPRHDTIAVDIEAPVRGAPRERLADSLREFADRVQAVWSVLMLPGQANIAEIGVRPVVMFIVEVAGRQPETYVAIIEEHDGTPTVGSFAATTYNGDLDLLRHLLPGSTRILN
ncbi:MAG TPA: hypothetical protein PKI27_00935 [Dermatophilaceae bacterium]|jgi:hypothetical protein|nr:hypothetical protein [Dermatophilaceae bacterium]